MTPLLVVEFDHQRFAYGSSRTFVRDSHFNLEPLTVMIDDCAGTFVGRTEYLFNSDRHLTSNGAVGEHERPTAPSRRSCLWRLRSQSLCAAACESSATLSNRSALSGRQIVDHSRHARLCLVAQRTKETRSAISRRSSEHAYRRDRGARRRSARDRRPENSRIRWRRDYLGLISTPRLSKFQFIAKGATTCRRSIRCDLSIAHFVEAKWFKVTHPATAAADRRERKLGTTFIIALADKYLEQQPIERQCLRWARAGVDIAPQTVERGVAAAIDLFEPVASCIAERAREPGVMSTDASGIPVLDRNAPSGIRTGTIWCWINSKAAGIRWQRSPSRVRTRPMGRMKTKPSWAARKKPRSPKAEVIVDEDGEGTFQLLFERQRELAERETRTIFFFSEENGIPPGEYAFAEAFCMGKNCDCRRVMFMVYRNDLDRRGPPRHIATLGYGWEPLQFYIDWMHGDREGAEFARGPIVEPNSPISGIEHRLLEVFQRMCLSDPAYVDRVRRHYEKFKRG